MGLGQIGTGPSPTMRNALFWPLLALTGLLAYLPALRSFFVKDDLILILSAQAAFPNLLIHSWPGGFFRPSAELLFAIQHALFGLHPLPYHLLSLAAHAAATLLLYRLFLRLLENRDLSRIGALVFALHPLHTESVSWISGQMSLFAGLCTLLLLYEPGRGHSFRLAIPALIVTVGLGFYESYAAAPILWLFLYFYMPRIRQQSRPIHFTVTALLATLTISTYLYWRFSVLGLRGGNYAVMPSIETVLTNLLYYLYLLFGGSAVGGRILYYQPGQIFSTTNFLQVFPPLLIATVVLLVAAGIRYARHRAQVANTSISRETLLPIVWLLIALLPALILPERPRRLAYTSIPAFALLVAMSFSYLQQKIRNGMTFTRAGLLFYSMIMAVTLHARNQDWQTAGAIEKDMATLVSSAQECASLVIDAPNLLGDALLFNSLSTERRIEQATGKHLPVYDAHQLPSDPTPMLPTCSFRYTNSGFVSTDSETPPYFVRGKNWMPSPNFQP
jgi:hypothetical protein